MKLVTFRTDSSATPRPGVLVGEKVVDLIAAWQIVSMDPAGLPHSVKCLLAGGPEALEAARVATRRAIDDSERNMSALLRADSLRLLPPIPDPESFLCVGKNYRAHLEELRRNDLLKEWPQEPTAFVKLRTCLVGQDSDVVRPDGITTFDYEPELVFAIGRPAYRVRKAEALDYVAGLMVLNDLTAREVQKQEVVSGTRFWTAKNMPGFGPVGPYLVTLDEIGDPHDLWLTCSVNGEQRIRVNTADQIFKTGDILEHFSRHIPFAPGDLFSTGSPGGVAVGQPNADELYLRPGDTVEVAIEGVMTLRTHIVGPALH